jgi:hypothetical protein
MSSPPNQILGQGEYAWFLLSQLEDTLMECADWIQLEDSPEHPHLETFSRRAALALFQVGTTAEAVIRDMVSIELLDQSPRVNPNDLRKAREADANIRDFRRVLEPAFGLSKRTVVFRLFSFTAPLKPFANFERTEDSERIAPTWWDAYNDVKHGLFQNIERATLRRLIEGSAAVFLLMVLCRKYWPVLVQQGRITILQVGSLKYPAVTDEIVWEKLHEAILEMKTPELPLILGDMIARSRLFYTRLAAQNSKTLKFEIPND